MAKLYFRYGVMSSSKSLNLLAVAHNYESYQNKPVFLIKPAKDTRGKEIESKVGISLKPDLILQAYDNNIMQHLLKSEKNVYCVLVDEAQFLSETQVYELTEIADKLDIPVICYGLKTNFQNNFNGFDGSEALLRWADKVEEIKTVCFSDKCNNKALYNMRLENGNPTFEGEGLAIGDTIHNSERNDKIEYKPVCRQCYKKEMNMFATRQFETPRIIMGSARKLSNQNQDHFH